MNKVIMKVDSLDDIARRLAGCQALLDALREVAGASLISEEALGSVSDLLEMIRRDLRADIDCAENEAEKEVGAA